MPDHILIDDLMQDLLDTENQLKSLAYKLETQCAFCGALVEAAPSSQNFIRGQLAIICNRCVAVCNEIIKSERDQDAKIHSN